MPIRAVKVKPIANMDFILTYAGNNVQALVLFQVTCMTIHINTVKTRV